MTKQRKGTQEKSTQKSRHLRGGAPQRTHTLGIDQSLRGGRGSTSNHEEQLSPLPTVLALPDTHQRALGKPAFIPEVVSVAALVTPAREQHTAAGQTPVNHGSWAALSQEAN